MKGDTQIPKWLSPGAQNMIRRILDPNPVTRITMEDIKSDEWFKQGYIPANPEEEEDINNIGDNAFSLHEVVPEEAEKNSDSPVLINAFQLIGMSSCLDLSGFFEKEVRVVLCILLSFLLNLSTTCHGIPTLISML